MWIFVILAVLLLGLPLMIPKPCWSVVIRNSRQLDGGWSYQRVKCEIRAAGSYLVGLLMPMDGQHMDTHSRVDHLEPHRAGAWPAGVGLARAAGGGGGGAHRRGRRGACHRASRCVHRQRRGGGPSRRPARAGRAVRRSRRDRRGGGGGRRDRGPARRARRRRPGGGGRGADRARRHAEQGPTRRQRADRGVDGQRLGRGRRPRPAAVAPPRRRCAARDAAARDPDLRWRCARRAAAGRAGLHVHRGRRRDLPPGARLERRGLPRGRRADGRGGPAAGGGRRGRLLAGLRRQRAGAGHAGARDRARGCR